MQGFTEENINKVIGELISDMEEEEEYMKVHGSELDDYSSNYVVMDDSSMYDNEGHHSEIIHSSRNDRIDYFQLKTNKLNDFPDIVEFFSIGLVDNDAGTYIQHTCLVWFLCLFFYLMSVCLSVCVMICSRLANISIMEMNTTKLIVSTSIRSNNKGKNTLHTTKP